MIRCVPMCLLAAVVLAASNPALARGQAQAEETRRQIAVLQSGADLHDKARACQRLAAVGGKEAVPVLAGLLADENLAAYARSALEAIADPSAGDALRKALPTLRGRFLLGAVNSLGVRGDARAVGALAGYVSEKDPELAAAALTALAEIGAPQALRAVERALGARSVALRESAAQACLLAGDRLLAHGNRSEMIRLCERVRQADVPSHLRLAAVQRLIVAKGAAGVALLEQQLASRDPAAVSMALRASRYVPGAEVTRALAAQLARATPADQPRFVQALLDRSGPGVLPAIETVAATGAPPARLAALKALGEIGASSSVPVLLRALASRDDAEAAAARDSLARLPGKEGDAQMLAALPNASPGARVRLMGVLAARNVSGAADAVLKQASSSDPEVGRAAFQSLVVLARPGDLAELVRLMVAARDEGTRDAAGRAVLAAAAKLPDIGGRSAPIAAAIKAASDPGVKAALLGLLSEIGTYAAYGVVRQAANDADPQVKLAAVRSLADWPDATPASFLLSIASNATDATVRSVALRGAMRMAANLAADCAYPSEQVFGWLDRARALVRDDADEKRLLVSAMGNLKSARGLALLLPYLTDAAVRNETALAVIQTARQMPEDQRPMAKPILEKIVATSGDDALRTQAGDVLKLIPGPGAELRVPPPSSGEVDESRLVFVPLFNGRTFDGWEGDTANAFRIEDGAIVGGSLKAALTQNEFLATTRSYANFVLRAECKLVGEANGGIQIRSQRVPRSSEMCGYQPDMDSSGQYWGCLYDESRRGMLVQADVSKTRQVVKPNDWNAYEIRAEGPRIRIYVNGLLTADYTEKDPEIVLSGLIGLQIHAGHPSETRYRNLRIAELP